MPDTRLIERWLPIAELGEESIRERRSMTALPPTYYLLWARTITCPYCDGLVPLSPNWRLAPGGGGGGGCVALFRSSQW